MFTKYTCALAHTHTHTQTHTHYRHACLHAPSCMHTHIHTHTMTMKVEEQEGEAQYVKRAAKGRVKSWKQMGFVGWLEWMEREKMSNGKWQPIQVDGPWHEKECCP